MLTIKQMEIVNDHGDNFDTFLRTQRGIAVSHNASSIDGGGKKTVCTERFIYDYETRTRWYPKTKRTVVLGEDQPMKTFVEQEIQSELD